MSRKLRDFVQLISQDACERQEAEIGSFVSWLRRRIALLKNLETGVVIDIIRHSKHRQASRDDILFQQGKQRESSESMKFFIILRGSVSMYVNPFISQVQSRSNTFNSTEKLLLTPSPSEKISSHPKSAASRRTASSYVSQTFAAVSEHSESDVSEDESELSIQTENTNAEGTSEQSKVKDRTELKNENSRVSEAISSGHPLLVRRDGTLGQEQIGSGQVQSPISRASKKSRKATPRSKLGNFIVKYEKGKYFGDDAIADGTGSYTASVIADEATDFIILEEDHFNRFVKEQHEQETMDITNFVDIHPFFCHLPLHSKGVIQICLKIEHHKRGSFIVKQGDPANRLIFIVSGSAEVIIDPTKHRYQYPDYWPFETSNDIYYNEFEWLRESRRRVYRRQYEFHGEVTQRHHARDSNTKQAISVCAVQKQEVVGITEVLLDLPTHMQGLRCLHDCEVYTLGLRPFRRIIRKKNPEILHFINEYVRMKLKYRMEKSIGDQVPFFNSLYVKLQSEVKKKPSHGQGTMTKPNARLKAREQELLRLLGWFKLDKAPLVTHMDPNATLMRENMKEKARVRESIRLRSKGGKQFMRSGCMVAVKTGKEAMSIHKLRNPMNEIMLRLKMEGTYIQDEDELEEFLLRYSETPDLDEDISRQAHRVVDEEYNLFRYRRHGNRLVRRFKNMLDTKDPTYMHLETDRALSRTVTQTDDVATDDRTTATEHHPDSYERALTRTMTHKSIASTYRTVQFERRSVTPNTIDMKIKNFHLKYGGRDTEINTLPSMRKFQHYQCAIDDEPPIPGGKVFVTKIPCVTCKSHVMLKNHTHIRCQMLHSLPMNRVKGYNREETAYY